MTKLEEVARAIQKSLTGHMRPEAAQAAARVAIEALRDIPESILAALDLNTDRPSAEVGRRAMQQIVDAILKEEGNG